MTAAHTAFEIATVRAAVSAPVFFKPGRLLAGMPLII